MNFKISECFYDKLSLSRWTVLDPSPQSLILPQLNLSSQFKNRQLLFGSNYQYMRYFYRTKFNSFDNLRTTFVIHIFVFSHSAFLCFSKLNQHCHIHRKIFQFIIRLSWFRQVKTNIENDSIILKCSMEVFQNFDTLFIWPVMQNMFCKNHVTFW